MSLFSISDVALPSFWKKERKKETKKEEKGQKAHKCGERRAREEEQQGEKKRHIRVKKRKE